MLNPADAIDTVAHIIQVALTPVFLLSGIGTLLNVFNTRLSRVSDHREHINELLRSESDDESQKALFRAHLLRLKRRTLVLDASVVLGATGAASTCGAAFALFLSTRSAVIVSWLYALFGVALACTVAALVCFLADTLLAWHGLHREGPMPHEAMKSAR